MFIPIYEQLARNNLTDLLGECIAANQYLAADGIHINEEGIRVFYREHLEYFGQIRDGIINNDRIPENIREAWRNIVDFIENNAAIPPDAFNNVQDPNFNPAYLAEIYRFSNRLLTLEVNHVDRNALQMNLVRLREACLNMAPLLPPHVGVYDYRNFAVRRLLNDQGRPMLIANLQELGMDTRREDVSEIIEALIAHDGDITRVMENIHQPIQREQRERITALENEVIGIRAQREQVQQQLQVSKNRCRFWISAGVLALSVTSALIYALMRVTRIQEEIIDDQKHVIDDQKKTMIDERSKATETIIGLSLFLAICIIIAYWASQKIDRQQEEIDSYKNKGFFDRIFGK